MAKKSKLPSEEDEIEEIDESYYSNSDQEHQLDSDAAEKVMQYEQVSSGDDDDSDSEESDQADLNMGMQKQKDEAMALQQTWGTSRANFYGRNKENDDESDTSDDQDELQQAERLQAIKA